MNESILVNQAVPRGNLERLEKSYSSGLLQLSLKKVTHWQIYTLQCVGFVLILLQILLAAEV